VTGFSIADMPLVAAAALNLWFIFRTLRTGVVPTKRPVPNPVTRAEEPLAYWLCVVIMLMPLVLVPAVFMSL